LSKSSKNPSNFDDHFKYHPKINFYKNKKV